MNADEIIRTLRENAEWCDANEYEVPICMGDNQREAADLLESLAAQLAESQRQLRAAVEDLRQNGFCGSCSGCNAPHDPNNITWCYSWQWRGPQAGEGEQ